MSQDMDSLFQSYSPTKYRKKPVVIEAICAVSAWSIDTLEGVMTANEGDYIIKGIQGEYYPCKPDIFEATYEKE